MQLFMKFNLFALLILGHSLAAQNIPEVDWTELQKTKPWEATQYYEPVPPVITPNQDDLPPSDAIVLFDGNNLDAWKAPIFGYGVNMEQISAMAKAMYELDYDGRKAAPWEVKSGQMIVVPGSGSLETSERFGGIPSSKPSF